MFMVAYGIVKPFMAEYVQKMINFHADFEALYEHVSQDLLPEEFGGNAGKFDNSVCVEQAKTMEQYFKARGPCTAYTM